MSVTVATLIPRYTKTYTEGSESGIGRQGWREALDLDTRNREAIDLSKFVHKTHKSEDVQMTMEPWDTAVF